ncbi:MAG: hypothetical protein ABIU05_16460, partial [Nitrospirales bacterium]
MHYHGCGVRPGVSIMFLKEASATANSGRRITGQLIDAIKDNHIWTIDLALSSRIARPSR